MSTKNTIKHSISPRLLLGIYSVLPIAVTTALVDALLLGGFLRSHFRAKPDDYALFTLLFTLPHIIASFFCLCDREYLDFYGQRLFKGFQFAVLAAVFLPLISLSMTFVVFALYTMYHVFRQQSGIAKTLMKGADRYFMIWEWVGIALSFGLYLAIYTTYRPSVVAVSVWAVGAAIYTAIAIRLSRIATTQSGRRYFWGTHSIPIVSGILFLGGYTILAIAVPRVIHDLTAYVFYTTHDANRFRVTQSNILYRSLHWTRLPIYILSPIVSVGIALLFQLNAAVGLYTLLSILFLFHYRLEGFIWKTGSLHRQHIGYSS